MHTKEPWDFGVTELKNAAELRDVFIKKFDESLQVHDGDVGKYVIEIYREDGARIAFMAGPTALENAKRLMLCVNACEYIDNETLEQVISGNRIITADIR